MKTMQTVLVTGGTGLVGSAITKALTKNGFRVVILTRSAKPSSGNVTYKNWDPEKGIIDKSAIEEADHIIHLAGENVAEGRWTEQRKKEIVDSRVKTAELLVKSLGETANKIQTVVSASAIGWYGPDPKQPNPKPFVENDPADDSFLGDTCQKWEAAIQPVAQLGKRLVTLRTGIVLSNGGGAYPEFKKPMNFGIAAILGNGEQVVSWIHVDDLVEIYLKAIRDENMHGIYNAVAPNPVTNKQLVLAIAKTIDKFHIPIHVPSFALKIALGEMSIEVLKSATVSSKKVEATGFHFLYPTINQALEKLSAP